MQRGQLAWRALTQAFKLSVETASFCTPRAPCPVPFQTEHFCARWLVSQTAQAAQAAPEPVRCNSQQAIWTDASGWDVALLHQTPACQICRITVTDISGKGPPRRRHAILLPAGWSSRGGGARPGGQLPGCFHIRQ